MIDTTAARFTSGNNHAVASCLWQVDFFPHVLVSAKHNLLVASATHGTNGRGRGEVQKCVQRKWKEHTVGLFCQRKRVRVLLSN